MRFYYRILLFPRSNHTITFINKPQNKYQNVLVESNRKMIEIYFRKYYYLYLSCSYWSAILLDIIAICSAKQYFADTWDRIQPLKPFCNHEQRGTPTKTRTLIYQAMIIHLVITQFRYSESLKYMNFHWPPYIGSYVDWILSDNWTKPMVGCGVTKLIWVADKLFIHFIYLVVVITARLACWFVSCWYNVDDVHLPKFYSDRHAFLPLFLMLFSTSRSFPLIIAFH